MVSAMVCATGQYGRYGMVWYGMVWYGMCHGMVGKVWYIYGVS